MNLEPKLFIIVPIEGTLRVLVSRLIYIVLMTGVLLQRGSSIGPGVIAAT